MGLNVYNIKKWIKMFAGKSVLHVNQGMGRAFVTDTVKGYFNDLTQKVLRQPEYVDSMELPTVKTEWGEDILFPVAIFQYALGCWDLYQLNHVEKYKKKFIDCANWALEMQEPCGAWNNFFFAYPKNPYGAMAQGEAMSVLVRAWSITKEEKYLSAARRAADFMLKPVEEGGTSQYCGNELILLEYTHLPAVLNGWIFSLFGLYDLCIEYDEAKYKDALNQTLDTLGKTIQKFDRGYWSNYDLDGHIASPFYHHLHVAQMNALAMITGNKIYNEYCSKWHGEDANKIKRIRATLVKGYQKIRN